MYTPCGLYYFFVDRNIPLPLLHVHAVANIKELAAHVKLTHTYANDTAFALEATYSFPIPARAAVCSFVMIKEDGTRVIGHVQEKGEAREIYASAVVQGKQAALMEQQTPDVFQLAVGNIQPQEKVRIELTYATELAEDEENDSVRFHLPVHAGARYGQAPYALENQFWHSLSPLSSQSLFLEIFVNVEAVAPIAKIGSPSHNVTTELGPDPELPNARELPFANYARISLSSEAALDRDFVLTVKSAGLDAPRCVAELHPIHPTTALTFTLVPRFKLADVSRQEFVFLVDRSGSMSGPRITAAKRALVVMLRSLPARDSLFQIASFGNTCTMLWDDGSRSYNQATLDDATQHVDSMQANYGGTKIREALAHCFAARKTDRPTSVFVLTDGAAWDVDGVLAEVKTAVASCAAQACLRVSVLGIGNSASTAMCEGIARVGDGTCMMVGEQETSFTGKIARMLKAACTPLITDIAVDWGVPVIEASRAVNEDEFVMVSDEEENGNAAGKGKGKEKAKTTLNIFDDTVDPLQADNGPASPPLAVVLAPASQVQQSPFKIRTLSPGNRLNVYAILQGRTVPQTVTLTGLAGDGSEIRLSVPVTLSNLPNAPGSPPAIHALAARKIIQDLEDGQHGITTSIPDDADLLARTVKASIVRLAKTYSISSSQTSFVAVDESSHQPQRSAPIISVNMSSSRAGPNRHMSQISIKRPDYVYRRRPNNSRRRAQASTQGDMPIEPLTSPWPEPATLDSIVLHTDGTVSRDTLGAPWLGPTMPFGLSLPVQHTDDAASKETQYLRRRCFTCHTTEASSWRRSTLHVGQIVCNKCGLYERTHARPRPARLSRSELARPEREPDHSVPEDPLEALARLQSFDGCFFPAVLSIIQLNVEASEARTALLDISEVFATVIGMAFLRSKLGPTIERESWEAMYNKARAFVEGTLLDIGDFVGADELEGKAISMLA